MVDKSGSFVEWMGLCGFIYAALTGKNLVLSHLRYVEYLPARGCAFACKHTVRGRESTRGRWRRVSYCVVSEV